MSKLTWAAVLFLLVPLAVTYDDPGRFATALTSTPLAKVKWPIANVEENTHGPSVFPGAAKMLYVEGVPGVPLAKLVRLTVFGDFRPGLTIEEAKARFGSPIRIRSDRGHTIAVYDLPDAHIEVEDQPYGSGCSHYHRRTVYAYPKTSANGCGAPASEVLHDSLNAQIPRKGAIELGITEAGYHQRVWVLVRDGCVEGMNWWVMPTK